MNKFKVGDEVLVKGTVEKIDEQHGTYKVVSQLGYKWCSDDVIVPVNKKTVMPKWFDEWYKKNNNDEIEDMLTLFLLTYYDYLSEDFCEEQEYEIADRLTDFIDAIRYGYEVEKESLGWIVYAEVDLNDTDRMVNQYYRDESGVQWVSKYNTRKSISYIFSKEDAEALVRMSDGFEMEEVFE